MIGTIVKAAILAMALAVWQVFVQPLYNAWLENMGKPTGVGETMLGYFVVILAAWLIAALITRRLGNG